MLNRHLRITTLLATTLLLTALVAGATSCGGGDDNQTLTVYSGRSEKLVGPIFAEFEAVTGVTLDVRYGSSNDLALAISTEGDKTPADVFLSRSPGPAGYLDDLAMLAPIDTNTLDRVVPTDRSPDGTWVGFAGRARVLVYNIDEVPEADLPGSVFDLTGPDYQNLVAVPGSNSSFQDWFTVFRLRNGDDVAIRWLDDMVANGARFYPKNRAIVEAVGRDEIRFGLVNHYYNHQEVAANGDAQRSANHGFNQGDDGGLMIIATAAVLNQSDEKELANRLLTHLLSDSQQRYLTDTVYEYPLAIGVEAAETLPPAPADTVGAVQIADVAAEFTRTIEIIEASGILDQ
ncbi:MAG TPA: extracellular solute-binding protein [Acidimicrobiales bacterium]|jgi:iron(III) transport system substrate-binding protein|nr:iron ABC transporter substrate-binding protein [Actinomycetota bacterium]MDP6062221.1 extracellular solute-binding protein [Acidimicrobiales bacterium]MDP7208496.1 extracellular solute-binding protein [Acidimicrobiales bacterium]HJL89152.1 extracellular solute-binding protein [Acidimicrobiales bacterium]HJO98607.1 extracellular solute-binding protein [Acidimicrobiales bacterium]|tara:strand:- start:18 stop:1055 length:1038 start_codon:yes stop_codon:yes gene_type:complete